MATHSSILAWKIPWTEEPGSLQSMGPQTPLLRNYASVFCLTANILQPSPFHSQIASPL